MSEPLDPEMTTLRYGWAQFFSAHFHGRDPTRSELKLARRAFYMGCLYLLETNADLAKHGTPEQFRAHMQGIEREFEAFERLIKEGRA